MLKVSASDACKQSAELPLPWWVGERGKSDPHPAVHSKKKESPSCRVMTVRMPS